MMIESIFLRRIFMNRIASYGMIHDGSIPLAVTIESPWRHNKINESCICIGRFPIEVVDDIKNKGDEIILVKDVPGRSGIGMHRGNHPKDTRGCILPGYMFDNDGSIKPPSSDALKFLCHYIKQYEIKYLVVTNLPAGI